jgi:hypothetical protein
MEAKMKLWRDRVDRFVGWEWVDFHETFWSVSPNIQSTIYVLRKLRMSLRDYLKILMTRVLRSLYSSTPIPPNIEQVYPRLYAYCQGLTQRFPIEPHDFAGEFALVKEEIEAHRDTLDYVGQPIWSHLNGAQALCAILDEVDQAYRSMALA